MPEEKIEKVEKVEPKATDPEKFTLDEFREGKWREAIKDEDYATHESLASVKEFDHFAKNYVEAQKFISSSDKIPSPKGDWGLKEWKEWNKSYGSKFGFPEDETGYELGKPEDYPEALSKHYNQDAEDFFRKQAHQNGLTKAQATKLWNSLSKNTADGYMSVVTQNTKVKQEALDSLKTELGNAYDEKIKATETFINRMDEDGSFRKWMKDTGAAGEAQLIKFAMRVSEHFKEDSITDGPLGKPETVNTPREAESRLNKIYSDAKHPFHDAFHPGHEAAQKEVQKLFEDAHPEDKNKKDNKIKMT